MSRFEAHCTSQARSCENLGSPFTAQLCRLLGAKLGPESALGAKLHNWKSIAADAVALRLCGGLHALVMTHPKGALARVYPPAIVDSATLWRAVEPCLREHSAFLLNWLNSAPQTNEIRRCSGLIPAFHWLAAQFDLPLKMTELGASAGLNSNWDAYCLNIDEQSYGPQNSAVQLAPEWRGRPPPPQQLNVIDRAACDLNPIDPLNPDSRDRMLAYIWADQPERRENTLKALEMVKIQPTKADAVPFLEQRLSAPTDRQLHIVFHSIFWQYLPAADQQAATIAMEKAAANATTTSPLAWVSMEADSTKGSAGLLCQTWPKGKAQSLGRVDFHGRWVDWQAE